MSMIHIHSGNTKSSASSVMAEDAQPNAIDLRLDSVFAINSDIFVIDEQSKRHRGTTKISPDQDGYYTLQPGQYDVTMANTITIGEGEAGWLIIRSTFNRNGVFITSGLYDSGFSGVVGGVLHVNVGPIRVKTGTRIAQFLLFSAENLTTYDGDYGFDRAGNAKLMESQLYYKEE